MATAQTGGPATSARTTTGRPSKTAIKSGLERDAACSSVWRSSAPTALPAAKSTSSPKLLIPLLAPPWRCSSDLKEILARKCAATIKLKGKYLLSNGFERRRSVKSLAMDSIKARGKYLLSNGFERRR